jgi:hypothetical protein
MKVKHCVNQDGKHYGWSFTCPGCGQYHVIPTDGGHDSDPQHNWSFNDNVDKPTFQPSLKVSWTEGEQQIQRICHSVITDGLIQFCGDCTHALVGKTVELPDIPDVTKIEIQN